MMNFAKQEELFLNFFMMEIDFLVQHACIFKQLIIQSCLPLSSQMIKKWHQSSKSWLGIYSSLNKHTVFPVESEKAELRTEIYRIEYMGKKIPYLTHLLNRICMWNHGDKGWSSMMMMT